MYPADFEKIFVNILLQLHPEQTVTSFEFTRGVICVMLHEEKIDEKNHPDHYDTVYLHSQGDIAHICGDTSKKNQKRHPEKVYQS